jgi:hemoglobin-like flavoprotein
MCPFTVTEIALVRESFRVATADPDAFAAAFFRELFTLDRSLRGLFRGDMRHLGHAFVTTLRVMVAELERFAEFAPHMRTLGARHAGYGVRPDHFALGSAALAAAVAERVGPAFHPGTRAAWEHVLEVLTGEIAAGARGALRTGKGIARDETLREPRSA